MTITDMDIERTTACGADVLVVGEGRDNDVIHRYCSRERRYGNETEDELLKDRFKVVKSRSRYLTLTWTTDSSNEYRGWRIEYEFMLESAECGFTTHAMTGMVHSPNWPQDYGNDEECLWDIQVPLGYHIHLQFTHFDIAPSEDCAKDSLTISQEHSSKALAPIGDYFFDFEDEERHSPLCGIALPKSFRSEKCGAAFRLIHGVISSPNYPSYYPNLNNVCEYLIAPEGDAEQSVIVVKLIDFDLSDSKMDYSRQPCASDYLEVRDVINKRIVTSYCGGEPMSEEAVAIKGAVGLRFITNQSYIYGPKKLHRGFQFSYSIDKCGGRIELNESSGYLATISSPAFPLDYPHNLDCLWNVTASDGRVISVKYEFMELEFSSGCGMDFVELHDGIDLNGTSMGKTCGPKSQMPPGRLYTKSNNLVVHFVTDHTLSKGGFKIVVIATLGQYIHNLHCGWNIIGEDRTMLELKLTKMDTEELQALPGQLSPSGSRCTDAITVADYGVLQILKQI
ncbi:unnamed protein product [Angiostrongylus costaricensis]|uniref:CUB domain-containing protein n=1 Tax=Angiostrongylus costaricensis TaxID=334426 RepID=A0A0R3PRL0_ANGCS|nr:unnamed protein product [Angiostrongylus costaricensis]